MSKYVERGAYHYAEFDDSTTPYHKHVMDLVQRINVFVEGDRIFEVGAGEGLILRQLSRLGFSCLGCDIDGRAVELAVEKGNDVRLGSIESFEAGSYDAVLMCDVLEHVEDFDRTIEAAQKMAKVVVVAVPDRLDRHAVRQHIVDAVSTKFLSWELQHIEQRHARWLMIFKNHK
jgi:2-polyprenyl-3-methyl-5-hydroxy-6-metoxy-1,4-benzoquinol methylase